MVEIRTKKRITDEVISQITGISRDSLIRWNASNNFKKKLYKMLKAQDEEWLNAKFKNAKFNPLLQRIDSSLCTFIGISYIQLNRWKQREPHNDWRWKMYILFNMESLEWLEKYFT